MKKLVIFFLLLNKFVFGQSVIIDSRVPNTNIELKTNLNIPGLLHKGSTSGYPSVGIVIKSDGPYLQTFTDHDLNFAVNNNAAPTMIVEKTGDVKFNGFTAVNNDVKGSYFKYKKFTGFTDAYNPAIPSSNDTFPYETRIAHGLDASKIISVDLVVALDNGRFVGPNFKSGSKFEVSYDDTYLHIWNYPAPLTTQLNRPFKVLISYSN
jgi:hypothetical protein